MEAKISKFFDSVGSFFAGGDQIPWADHDIILGCEREVAEAAKGDLEELKSESIMRLSWALVHSKRSEDVQRGIAMLEGYIASVGLLVTWIIFVAKSLLVIAPDWRQALVLKKAVEDRIARDGVIGIGITATAVGLIAAGIAGAVGRKK